MSDKEIVHLMVKETPLKDRPREKLLSIGAKHLTDDELLAIILRTGTKNYPVTLMAKTLLEEHKNLAYLSNLTEPELIKKKGIAKDKAATLLAVFEIAKRIIQQQRVLKDNTFTNPKHLAEYYIPRFVHLEREMFMVVCLSSSNKIIHDEIISEGILNGTVVHPREVFKKAIINGASQVIVIHNHPSGNPEPSNEDIAITRRLTETGRLIDIPVIDHIILAGTNYTSFAERRLL